MSKIVPIKEWRWNFLREKVALAVAEEADARIDICSQHGIGRDTLQSWMATPEFQQRVEELRAEFRRVVLSRGLTQLYRRIQGMQDRYDRLYRVIIARAEDAQKRVAAGDDTVAPGAEQGLFVRQERIQSKTRIIEWRVDGVVLSEMRELEAAVAKQLGQIIDRTQEMTDEEVTAVLEHELAKVTGKSSVDPDPA